VTEKPCTWKIVGHADGPYGRCMGTAEVKAPNPDAALHIAQTVMKMYDFVRIEHVSGLTGHVS